MEEEFEEFVVESNLEEEEEEEIDTDYEFDAPRFCDFSRPETHWDAVEAEQWFESARTYPPSPFVLRIRWGKYSPSGIVYTSSSDFRDEKSSNIVNGNSAHTMEYEVSVDGDARGKTKCVSKSGGSKSSTFMKPTASHLAKQRNPPAAAAAAVVTTTRTFTSFALVVQVDLTEANSSSRPKVTIPKQFDLETAHRAEKHKSRNNTESGGHRKSSSQTFKALPLNKKILEAPSLSFRKKKTPQLTEFHEFHLKTSERAMQHTSSNVSNVSSNCSSSSNRETRDSRRQNSAADASRQEKCRPINKLRGSSESMDKSCLNEPPTEQLNKLSLASEVRKSTKSQPKEKATSKDLKENRPGYFQLEHERLNNYIKEEIQRACGKQYHQCMTEISDITHASMLAVGSEAARKALGLNIPLLERVCIGWEVVGEVGAGGTGGVGERIVVGAEPVPQGEEEATKGCKELLVACGVELLVGKIIGMDGGREAVGTEEDKEETEAVCLKGKECSSKATFLE
ncbi:protein TPX2-like isoform X2 [Senna tora]|uniref:Protein TPX2-like isoform X2 n=1 Tax=Senna tora TaxID=362788 RepID=A0A834T1L6_9FABA|nr:protein TPX2-like isoform X2 [Senna tora]